MSTQHAEDPKEGRAEFAGLFGGATLLVVVGAILAWQFVQPAPPSRITIAAGGESGAYYRYAEQYRAILARSGISLEVLATNGSVENLAPDAARYFQNGPPFLQRYLPFWAANLIDRLKVMLLPLIGLLIPLVKIMPPVYRWRIRSRILRWYRELRRIDLELELSSGDPGTLKSLAERLAGIESDAAQVEVPLSYSDQLYNLRLHMRLIAEKLERLGANPVAAPALGAGKHKNA